MKNLEWPNDYIERKLAVDARLSSFGDLSGRTGEAVECAREIWELLMRAEVIADGFKTEAAEAKWAVDYLRAAADRLVIASKALNKRLGQKA